MSYLYLDIETRPSHAPEIHASIAAAISPPGNISKAETIAQWEAEKKPLAVKEAIAKTALDGAFGHVCCIGWAFDEEPARHAMSTDTLDEKDVIRAFLDAVAHQREQRHNLLPVIVGHNVIGFDIRFLWQRAIVLGITMPTWFPRDPKPWAGEAVDTMTAFAGSRGMIGMDKLCQALGIEGKDGIDGSMIGDLWARGEFSTIAAYCRADVERTREIHRRMMVAFGEIAA